MSLTQDQKNRITEIVKEILLRRIENFPETGEGIRNAPFHDAFLECFKEKIAPFKIEIPYLIAIASWLHGLNTSLGSGFEGISHILSGGYKRKFSKGYVLKVKKEQAIKIEGIIRDLKAGVFEPDLQREDDLIFRYDKNGEEINSLEFTVDNYIEKPDEIIAIELKSVRPNSGEGKGEKQKILYAKAALKLINPNKKIKYLIGFPFDPTSEKSTGYNKDRFFDYLIEFEKFFSKDEILIAGELWDFLSGQKGTMEEILNLIADTVRQVKK